MVVENQPQADPAELRKAEATRQRILDAAARVFVEKGYVATRLNDIASAAEMQAGSIYYHFDSKEQIFEEVVDLGMRRVVDSVRAAVEALGPTASHRERIGAALEAHLHELLLQSDYTSANIRNFGQIPEELQQRNMGPREDYGAYWRNLLDAARAAGEIRADVDLSLVRMLLLGALNWSVEWYDPNGKPIADVAAELQRLLFDGVGTDESEY
jgi:AcrR family transcriptional regulator